jgi:two-component system, cell cycle sensor histidine kinase and response regulator CckA
MKLLDEGLRQSRQTDLLVVGLALAFSVLLVGLVVRDAVVTSAFAGALAAFAGLAFMVSRSRPPQTEAEFAHPDWSVTVVAIDRPDMAIAVTDRAGRLTCANASYEAWFGVGHAPQRLPLELYFIPVADPDRRASLTRTRRPR